MVNNATPGLQSRSITTPFPGPRPVALHAGRVANVSADFAVTLPIFVERAEGGILQGVDGNRVIDFASGIAVTSVGATNPLVQACGIEATIREMPEPPVHTVDAVAEVRGRGAMMAIKQS